MRHARRLRAPAAPGRRVMKARAEAPLTTCAAMMAHLRYEASVLALRVMKAGHCAHIERLRRRRLRRDMLTLIT